MISICFISTLFENVTPFVLITISTIITIYTVVIDNQISRKHRISIISITILALLGSWYAQFIVLRNNTNQEIIHNNERVSDSLKIIDLKNKLSESYTFQKLKAHIDSLNFNDEINKLDTVSKRINQSYRKSVELQRPLFPMEVSLSFDFDFKKADLDDLRENCERLYFDKNIDSIYFNNFYKDYSGGGFKLNDFDYENMDAEFAPLMLSLRKRFPDVAELYFFKNKSFYIDSVYNNSDTEVFIPIFIGNRIHNIMHNKYTIVYNHKESILTLIIKCSAPAVKTHTKNVHSLISIINGKLIIDIHKPAKKTSLELSNIKFGVPNTNIIYTSVDMNINSMIDIIKKDYYDRYIIDGKLFE